MPDVAGREYVSGYKSLIYFMNNNDFLAKKIKILAVMLFSVAAVKLFAPQVFVANTPRVNPFFVYRVINAPSYFASLPGRFIASLKNSQKPTGSGQTASSVVIPTVKPQSALVFVPVAKGVSAAEDSKSKKTFINIKQGTKMKVSQLKYPNGQIVTVLEPETQ
jgi:hypothetical protein